MSFLKPLPPQPATRSSAAIAESGGCSDHHPLHVAVRMRLRSQVLHDMLAHLLWVPYCAICTGPIVQLALTNTCLHQFCFECIAQWTTITPECPLCRCVYQTVLCDIRSADEYRELQIVAERMPPPVGAGGAVVMEAVYGGGGLGKE